VTSQRIRKGLLALTLVATGIPMQPLSLFGQTDKVGTRQVKRRIPPEYPEVAKRMNLTGKVKVEVVVAPNGQVTRTRGVGGHPLLLRAAEAAVKDWKFSPGAEETIGVVEIEFAGTEVH
jgi:TonB family protein